MLVPRAWSVGSAPLPACFVVLPVVGCLAWASYGGTWCVPSCEISRWWLMVPLLCRYVVHLPPFHMACGFPPHVWRSGGVRVAGLEWFRFVSFSDIFQFVTSREVSISFLDFLTIPHGVVFRSFWFSWGFPHHEGWYVFVRISRALVALGFPICPISVSPSLS